MGSVTVQPCSPLPDHTLGVIWPRKVGVQFGYENPTPWVKFGYEFLYPNHTQSVIWWRVMAWLLQIVAIKTADVKGTNVQTKIPEC